MLKYRVDYEFKLLDPMVSDGRYHVTYLDNNGDGFSYEDAKNVSRQLKQSSIQRTAWTKIVEM